MISTFGLPQTRVRFFLREGSNEPTDRHHLEMRLPRLPSFRFLRMFRHATMLRVIFFGRLSQAILHLELKTHWSNMQPVRCPFVLLLVTLFDVAISWEAPLIRGARISDSELDDLSKRAQQTSKQQEAGSMPVVNGCPTCSKTYSEACPLTWEPDEDDLCHAPNGYTGYCAHGLHFGGLSVESKIVAEMSCSMCWPCKDGSASNAASRPE